MTTVKPDDLGQARRAWADRFYFGVVGGRGNPRALRQHIQHLRAAFKSAQEPTAREALRQRIGKLMGGSATVWVGAATDSEIKARKELAERTASALRGALLDGALPGGGAALMDCRPALQSLLHRSVDPDERAAGCILIRALEEPMRTIIGNATGDASRIMADVAQAGPGSGFDVTSGKVVNMAAAGIFDVATAVKAAVHGATATAALALTIEVLVHHKKPDVVLTPR